MNIIHDNKWPVDDSYNTAFMNDQKNISIIQSWSCFHYWICRELPATLCPLFMVLCWRDITLRHKKCNFFSLSEIIAYGMSPWWSLLRLLPWLPTLIARFMGPTWGSSWPTGPRWAPGGPHEPCYLGTFNSSYFNSFEIQVLVDFIYGYLIFKRVEVT